MLKKHGNISLSSVIISSANMPSPESMNRRLSLFLRMYVLLPHGGSITWSVVSGVRAISVNLGLKLRSLWNAMKFASCLILSKTSLGSCPCSFITSVICFDSSMNILTTSSL